MKTNGCKSIQCPSEKGGGRVGGLPRSRGRKEVMRTPLPRGKKGRERGIIVVGGGLVPLLPQKKAKCRAGEGRKKDSFRINRTSTRRETGGGGGRKIHAGHRPATTLWGTSTGEEGREKRKSGDILQGPRISRGEGDKAAVRDSSGGRKKRKKEHQSHF